MQHPAPGLWYHQPIHPRRFLPILLCQFPPIPLRRFPPILPCRFPLIPPRRFLLIPLCRFLPILPCRFLLIPLCRFLLIRLRRLPLPLILSRLLSFLPPELITRLNPLPQLPPQRHLLL